MPAVLVHGVPETPAIWEPLADALSRSDIVTLQLPGFACPRPDGFGATKEEYVAWLAGFCVYQWLEPSGPAWWVDLVGHTHAGSVAIGGSLPSFAVSFAITLAVAAATRMRHPRHAPA